MDAVVWSDFLCPWCYLGTTRTALLESLGVRVTVLPYELHPEIGPAGRRVGPRVRATYERVGTLCRDAGLPFRVPELVPSTRQILETSEWVRVNKPDLHAEFNRAAFAALFVDGRDLGDPEVVDSVTEDVGVDAALARAAVDAGDLRGLVDGQREAAIDAGATGAPSWLIDGRLLLPGVQEPGLYERLVARLRARSG